MIAWIASSVTVGSAWTVLARKRRGNFSASLFLI
jgi:hypothetical protein